MSWLVADGAGGMEDHPAAVSVIQVSGLARPDCLARPGCLVEMSALALVS
jgi:hypothetical protein